MELKGSIPAAVAFASLAAAIIIISWPDVQAQDRLPVKATFDNHHATRYLIVNDGDGGIARRDLWQEAADDCTAAQSAFNGAKELHITTGTPSTETLKQWRADAKVTCDDYRTLANSVKAARAVYEGAEQAYGCQHLAGPCPDGGL